MSLKQDIGEPMIIAILCSSESLLSPFHMHSSRDCAGDYIPIDAHMSHRNYYQIVSTGVDDVGGKKNFLFFVSSTIYSIFLPMHLYWS